MQPPAKKGNTKLVLGIVGGFLALCCGGVAVAAIASGGTDTTNASAEQAPAAAATTGAAPAATTTAAAPVTKAAEVTEAAEAPAAAPKADAGPGIGDKVRDGKFEFTVTKVACGKTQVGNEFLNQKAQGVYCLVDVTVKNIGKEAQMFSGAAQKAYDGAGTEFSNDGAAEIYANEAAQTFLNDINPGNQVKGKLVFDVPKGTKLTELELHDSIWSGGVKVQLS
ncbi:DUF4352 domain-containing protein [Spirilliplanes yamanashiensis]|uniref:DUF4352 domain-containing protein n=1 Tax=Spirilliplanes yamanashiensis TaxID=42233 RepID=A0A8J4DHZ9_9ACTN|nr:DUF4352 domain-containing protein [Spirilliplanes yamanashiensis]MDP9819273.1 hypothetical protein [Spirilliplanes yamanashiensis]GIJ01904.1 hypothetical protein Sya03_12560 [Spirilliplanes yamanashiensis]